MRLWKVLAPTVLAVSISSHPAKSGSCLRDIELLSIEDDKLSGQEACTSAGDIYIYGVNSMEPPKIDSANELYLSVKIMHQSLEGSRESTDQKVATLAAFMQATREYGKLYDEKADLYSLYALTKAWELSGNGGGDSERHLLASTIIRLKDQYSIGNPQEAYCFVRHDIPQIPQKDIRKSTAYKQCVRKGKQ